MAITKQAKKRIRVDARKQVANKRRTRAMKEIVKEVRELAVAGKSKEAAKMPKAQKAIDKAVKQGIIKKNTAARKKSRLVALIQRSK